MAKLMVYFEEKLVDEILEEQKYSAFTFLSGLGGAISLYLVNKNKNKK